MKWWLFILILAAVLSGCMVVEIRNYPNNGTAQNAATQPQKENGQ